MLSTQERTKNNALNFKKCLRFEINKVDLECFRLRLIHQKCHLFQEGHSIMGFQHIPLPV